MKAKLCIFLSVVILMLNMPPLFSFANTQPADTEKTAARDISSETTFTSVGFTDAFRANNGGEGINAKGSAGASFTLQSDEPIGSLYVAFGEEYGEWQITAEGSETVYRQSEIYIHQYVDISAHFGGEVKKITLTFPQPNAKISEIYVFSIGESPDWVQKWDMPHEKADVLLVTTHSDDELLFFTGAIPYYTAIGRSVQVVYLTEHTTSNVRHHERLNGLWKAGLRNYPVFGGFTDRYSEGEEWAKRNLIKDGHTMEELDSFCTEILRRFKPKVLLAHDLNGEYGHGQHILCATGLARALKASTDETKFPESAEKYGTYDVPKAYFHLYKERPIVFNWDIPMEQLGGMTPFEVSREAFKCHESQYDYYAHFLFGTKSRPINLASEVTYYSACHFGLYRSTVGDDSGIGDIFENLIPYTAEPTPPENTPPENTEDSTVDTGDNTKDTAPTDTETSTDMSGDTKDDVTKDTGIDTNTQGDKNGAHSTDVRYYTAVLISAAAVALLTMTVIYLRKKK